MNFYDLAQGGDPTHGNLGLYSQNAAIPGLQNHCGTKLRPAGHMDRAAYNIWRNINFDTDRKNNSQLGIKDFMETLNNNGSTLVPGDMVGVVTVPHEAIVSGVYIRIETPQEGTVIQMYHYENGVKTHMGPAINADSQGFYLFDTSNNGSFVVPPTSNGSVGFEIVNWPELQSRENDYCGLFGPCDRYTLCITFNVFIWSPVATFFCAEDKCHGLGQPCKAYEEPGAPPSPVVDTSLVLDQTANPEEPFEYVLDENAFTHPDGEDLTLSATGLPDWMSFNPATGTFSGTPPAGASGEFHIVVTATAPDGSTATDAFVVTV